MIMKQKRLLVLIGLLIGFSSLQLMAQSNTVAAGGEATGSGGTASYSIGQLDYVEATGSGGTANQGVQQPYEILVLGSNDFDDIELFAAVYPNPTVNNVTLKVGNMNRENLSYLLSDLSGRVILQKKILMEETVVPMESLSTSTYFLTVFEVSEQLKTFKIIKK